jgi:uncharacterized membrane protein YhhN
MYYTLLFLALLIAMIEWLAVEKGWRLVEYFAKPGTMVALLVWVWQVGGFHGPMIWFVVGLTLSLIGDVLLLLWPERLIGGLVAFLLAHLAYIVGFNTTVPPFNTLALILVFVVAILAQRLYRRINAGLVAQGQVNLRFPILAYSIVISLMLLSALWTLARPAEWTLAPASLVSLGALLFFASDSLLAWNQFIAPIRHGRTLVMVTYNLGQMGIALGAVLHFL